MDEDQPLGSECALVSSLPPFVLRELLPSSPAFLVPQVPLLGQQLCAKGWDAAQGQVSALCRRAGQTHHLSGNSKNPETLILTFLKV